MICDASNHFASRSPAVLALALRRQLWTSSSFQCPELARVSIRNDVKHILEVHIWNTGEPMHEALHVWLAANLVALLSEKANEENLHLTWATKSPSTQPSGCRWARRRRP